MTIPQPPGSATDEPINGRRLNEPARVSDEQVTSLLARLKASASTGERLPTPDECANDVVHQALLRMVFTLVLFERFGEEVTRADVIRFVSRIRQQRSEDVDPETAERVIIGVYTRAKDIDEQTKLSVIAVVLPALIRDLGLEDARLVELVREARQVLEDRWAS